MRLPILVHNCDDLEIEYKAGSYKPHEGEDVWFIPYISAPNVMQLMSLANSDDDNAITILIDDVAPVLAKVIDSWTWTSVIDDKPIGKKDGKRYRPSGADIGALSHHEIMYLVDAFFTETQPDENPQSASLEES